MSKAYEPLRVLGRGSFGEAVLAKHCSSGGFVVLKNIQIGQLSRKEQKEADNEIRILRRLNHPNIVRYIDSFADRSRLCIVMEYADGGDLAKLLKDRRGRLLGEDMIMHVFLQLCLAMKHLHDQHILHRDLKAGNIFLTAHRTHPVVKLGDFGLSTSLQSTMALARTVCGTPYYFSPELCQNKPYSNKSDLWAMGCILYELCTLQHAFTGTSMQSMMQRIVRGSYKPISKSLGEPVRNLVDALLQRDPSVRPSINRLLSADWVQRKVRQLVEGAPQRGTPSPAKSTGSGGTAARHEVQRKPVPGAKRPSSAAADASVVLKDKLSKLVAERQHQAKGREWRQQQQQQKQQDPKPKPAPDTPGQAQGGVRRNPPGPARPAGGAERAEQLAQQAAKQKEQIERRMKDAMRREAERQQQAQKKLEREKQAHDLRAAQLEERRKQRLLEFDQRQALQNARAKEERRPTAPARVERRNSAPMSPPVRSDRDGWMQIDHHVEELRRQMDIEAPSKFAQMRALPADPAAAAFLEARMAAQMNRNKPCNPFRGDESRLRHQEQLAQQVIQHYLPDTASPSAHSASPAPKPREDRPTPPQRITRVAVKSDVDLDRLLEPFGDDEPSDDLWLERQQAIERGRLQAQHETDQQQQQQQAHAATPPAQPAEGAAPSPPQAVQPLRCLDEVPAGVAQRRGVVPPSPPPPEEAEEPPDTTYAEVLAQLQANVLDADLCREGDDFFEEAPQQLFVSCDGGLSDKAQAIREHLTQEIGEGLFQGAFAALLAGDDAKVASLLQDHQALMPLFSQLLYCAKVGGA